LEPSQSPQPELLSFESHFSLSIHALPIFILTSFCNFIRYPTLIIMTQMTDDHYDTDDYDDYHYDALFFANTCHVHNYLH